MWSSQKAHGSCNWQEDKNHVFSISGLLVWMFKSVYAHLNWFHGYSTTSHQHRHRVTLSNKVRIDKNNLSVYKTFPSSLSKIQQQRHTNPTSRVWGGQHVRRPHREAISGKPHKPQRYKNQIPIFKSNNSNFPLSVLIKKACIQKVVFLSQPSGPKQLAIPYTCCL